MSELEGIPSVPRVLPPKHTSIAVCGVAGISGTGHNARNKFSLLEARLESQKSPRIGDMNVLFGNGINLYLG